MAVPDRLKDWLTSPPEDVPRGSIVNAGMVELVRLFRESRFAGAVFGSSFHRTEGLTGRILEWYTLTTATNKEVYTYIDGARLTSRSAAADVQYMPDGTTEIARIDRTAG